MKRIYSLFVLIALSLISCSKKNTTSDTGNSTPDIQLNASQTQTAIDNNIQFSISINSDLPSNVANINWEFGDGSTYFGSNYSTYLYHQFKDTGTYEVKAKLLLQNNKEIEVKKTIKIININIVRIKNITILAIPAKTSNERFIFYSNGLSGYWANFTGEWDESKSYGTTDVDQYADIYLKLSKTMDIPDATNPSELISDYTYQIATTPVIINQKTNFFDLTSANIKLSLSAIKKFTVAIMDSDLANSLAENNTPDDGMGEWGSIPSDFQNNVINVTSPSGVSYKIEYETIN